MMERACPRSLILPWRVFGGPWRSHRPNSRNVSPCRPRSPGRSTRTAMGITTEIPWCDSTINPIMGCDGCELHRAGAAESHCYAAALTARYSGSAAWPRSFDEPTLFAQRWQQALKWPDLTARNRPQKPWLDGLPRLIFCCDLGDPFAESLPLDWLAPWLPQFADSPHHWLFLTKRPSRARRFFQDHHAADNMWLGVSVTSSATLQRIDELQKLDTSTRFISAEPLLGPLGKLNLAGIHQVIVGGESRPGLQAL